MQEVTPLILEILSNMEWWQQYTVSPHPRDMTYFTLLLVKRAADPSLRESAFRHREFHNSVMGGCVVCSAPGLDCCLSCWLAAVLLARLLTCGQTLVKRCCCRVG
jgi:hypothetical protein